MITTSMIPRGSDSVPFRVGQLSSLGTTAYIVRKGNCIRASGFAFEAFWSSVRASVSGLILYCYSSEPDSWKRMASSGCFNNLGVLVSRCPYGKSPRTYGSVLGPLIFGNSQVRVTPVEPAIAEAVSRTSSSVGLSKRRTCVKRHGSQCVSKFTPANVLVGQKVRCLLCSQKRSC